MRHAIAVRNRIQRMLDDDKGATMVEYAFMVAFIAMVAVAAVAVLGMNLNDKYLSFTGLFP